jgi:flagellar assembly protein FliH
MQIQLRSAPKKLSARWLPALQEVTPYDRGFTKGYADGLAQAQEDCRRELEQRIKTSRDHWDSVTRALNAIPTELILKLREQLVNIAFATVRKILAATPVTREEVTAQLNQMLEHVEAGTEIEIQLNPADLELLTAEDRGALWNEELGHLKWTPSPAVSRGSCIIQGDFGWVDGRRETRVSKLEQATINSISQAP